MLGKLAVALAPPEPQLQHAALRLTARGWETLPLPAPDGSGAIVVGARPAHARGARRAQRRAACERVALGPDGPSARSRARCSRRSRELAGPVEIDPTPQEVPWSVPLDEDDEHARYDRLRSAAYFAAATQAALVLAAFRAPYRGRSTPVNAWWGSFDLAVNLFSGLPAEPPSQDFIMRNAMDVQEVAVGWWPGDARYEQRGLLRLRPSRRPKASPQRRSRLRPRAGSGTLGEYVLDWDDVRSERRPARRRARVRPLGLRPRLRRLRLGPGARRQRRGHARRRSPEILHPHVYGSGAALTLDEFALWLNLEDDYWTVQGRESIDAVVLFGSLLSMSVLGRGFFAELLRSRVAPRQPERPSG